MLKDMFKKTYTKIDTIYHRGSDGREAAKDGSSPAIPEGLWRKCNKCGKPIYTEDVRNNYYICPKCGGYMVVKGNKIACADAGCGYTRDRKADEDTK